MKAYVITTGSLFGLLALAHVWRIIAERPHVDLVEAAIGVLAAALCVWAFRVLRSSTSRGL